ncbi:MAG: hypothetical protein C0423_02195 [Methylibium sp.]|nr:hypothetical protein [Methylibium sp.]
METATPNRLDRAAKLLSLLTDTCRFLVLLALTAFALTAMASPDWARKRLADLGLSVKEVNAFGVRLVANEAFDVAANLAEARATLDQLKAQPGIAVDASALKKVSDRIEQASASLGRQDQAIKDVRQQAGIVPPPLPETGWVYVGRLAEDRSWLPGWSIDATRTRLDGAQVRQLGLKADAVVLGNGNECTQLKLEELQPPTAQDLQAPQILLDGEARPLLDVIATASCPSKGKGQWLYAKIRIARESVKFVKYQDLIRR